MPRRHGTPSAHERSSTMSEYSFHPHTHEESLAQELAERLGRSLLSVRSRRLKKTSVRYKAGENLWAAKHVKLLGTMSDKEVARQTGRGVGAVRTPSGRIYRFP